MIMAGAIVLQTALFFVTFKLGSNYLSDHRAKVKEERKLALIHDSMMVLHELRLIWIEMCKMDPALYRSATSLAYDGTPAIEGIGEVFQRRYQENKDRLYAIRSTLRVNAKLINEPSIVTKFEGLILTEESARNRYEELSKCRNQENCQERIKKIPENFYETGETTLGLNSAIQQLIDELERKYKRNL